MIKKSYGKKILDQFALIESLFDKYYSTPSRSVCDEDVVANIHVEVHTLKDIIWHEVDIETARTMDKQDGYDRSILTAR
jgi:hypothetical protein